MHKTWRPLKKSPVFKNENQLRAYQLEGLNWLLYNWYNDRGSILADEMGLGKTVQAVSFVELLRRQEGVRGPFLVIAPLSTIGHWQREFAAWTNLNVVTYLGSREDRQIVRKYEWSYRVGDQIVPDIVKVALTHLLTVNYLVYCSDHDI